MVQVVYVILATLVAELCTWNDSYKQQLCTSTDAFYIKIVT